MDELQNRRETRTRVEALEVLAETQEAINDQIMMLFRQTQEQMALLNEKLNLIEAHLEI